MNETNATKPAAGMIQPRYGKYGITGWDAIVTGLDLVFFATKKKAADWMKANGYEIVG